MKLEYLFTFLAVFSVILSVQSIAQEEQELKFPISDVSDIITQTNVEIDRSTEGETILLVKTQEPISVELFELKDEDFKNKRLTYTARMRSEDLTATEDSRGISFLEMIAKFPDGEELIARGPRVPLTGTTNWRGADAVLYIDKASSPDLIKLNLIVEGEGKVWLESVKLDYIPLRLNYLFWGHVVVWLVLILYIYNLFRKNRELKKQLETV
ncbi:MAG: hypothetical protein AAF462_11195 [Thermodesulfobacteriota bacterium]